MNTKQKSKKLRNDLVLVGVILTFAVVVFVIFRLNLKTGAFVNVSVDNHIIHTFNLNKDIEKKIKTVQGENIILIKNGEVTVKSADCPDKICVEHRAISKTGETIVCLPHKLVIEIVDEV